MTAKNDPPAYAPLGVIIALLAACAFGVAGCRRSAENDNSASEPNNNKRYAKPTGPDFATSFLKTDGHLRNYFRSPIHPQGKPPTTFTEVEASLRPDQCGVCHPAQFQLWSKSRHSMATGPGIRAQMLPHMRDDSGNPKDLQPCSRCHFPLAEQHRSLKSDRTPNPDFDPKLYEAGVTCAVCHVRDNVRHGPPRRGVAVENAPHAGFKVKEFFTKSEFCANCHQFRPGEFAVNGKFIENTLNEWQASRYAKEGVQCQGCHMPDRQHLFRGIHDKETTAKGVTIALGPVDGNLAAGKTTLTITNSGVGHHFPTYVTPAVYVDFHLERDGEPLVGSTSHKVIQRLLAVTNLSDEKFDTRIAAGDSATFDYAWGDEHSDHPIKGGPGTELVVTVTVDPDEFYRRFYTLRLKKKMDADIKAQFEQALTESRANIYQLWQKRVPLHP